MQIANCTILPIKLATNLPNHQFGRSENQHWSESNRAEGWRQKPNSMKFCIWKAADRPLMGHGMNTRRQPLPCFRICIPDPFSLPSVWKVDEKLSPFSHLCLPPVICQGWKLGAPYFPRLTAFQTYQGLSPFSLPLVEPIPLCTEPTWGWNSNVGSALMAVVVNVFSELSVCSIFLKQLLDLRRRSCWSNQHWTQSDWSTSAGNQTQSTMTLVCFTTPPHQYLF